MSKFVLDTNVLISNPYSIFSFTEENTEIIVTSATMGELDHLKTKQEISREVRLAIRLLSSVVSGHSYEEISKTGVKLSDTNKNVPESVTLKILDYVGPEKFELSQQDARIIATCKQEGAVLVTRDLNMLLIAMSQGCETLQYTGDDTLKDSDVLYSGYSLSPDFWNTVDAPTYTDGAANVLYSSLNGITDFYPGQYVISDGDLVGRVTKPEEYHLPVVPIDTKQAMTRKLYKQIQARDAYQAAFIDAVNEPDVDIVSVMGGAGAGKTMLAVAAAVHLVHGRKYANMMYVKADSPLTSEIGFLPGTLGEKLRPSVEPCITSLKILFKDMPDPDKHILELMEKQTVQFPSLYYFRGMSIGHPDAGKGSVLIVDECQNLSNHEIKSIISRLGENSLLILCGNIKQIDNPRNTAINNGFVYAVEKLKEYEHARHIILDKIYRGRLAAFVEDKF